MKLAICKLVVFFIIEYSRSIQGALNRIQYGIPKTIILFTDSNRVL